MDIKEYFNEIQEYIKSEIGDDSENTIKLVMDKMNDNNVQALVNQAYNDKKPVEEIGQELVNSIDVGTMDKSTPDTLKGDRTLNTQESRVMNYKSFLNENK